MKRLGSILDKKVLMIKSLTTLIEKHFPDLEKLSMNYKDIQ